MMKSKILVLLALLAYLPGFANVSLPEIFSDNMVLQRNAAVKIWGWAKPGEEIHITTTWDEQEYTTKASNKARWEIILNTPGAKGAQEITITGYNQVKLKNVLLGEVWLVSGQSNMEWSAASGITNAEEAIAGAKNQNIRFFTVAHRTAENMQQDLDGHWVESTPETMKNFSAIAYFFGKKLQEELDVPVGLINSSWGGTPAEAWTPSEAITSNKRLTKGAAMLPEVEWGPKEPGLIYNSMIAPLAGLKIKGVLWYQGESNTDNADYYQETFSTLIQSWRKQWDEEFPFYYAQIAPFNYGDNDAGVTIRNAQRQVLELPKTGMIMTSDIGNTENIHPKNKLDPGLRFANLVLKEVYNKDIKNAYAPQFEKAEVDGRKVKIQFSHAEGLHINKKNKDSQFEVAGANGEFYPAKVSLKDDRIIVKSAKVKEPKSIRYSWGNTSTSNVFNASGLPASSFLEEL
ncbi:sialate O-acetylesterase [Zunongwangia sp. H14]|uniref:sialate O-acetylesterase n=1 Tax=Zunongwangia sp. H14 TaxID=3240792 RepID=UPI003562C6F2